MVPAPFIVVVDANVLFPLTLRDTILRAAAAGFYQLRWSAEILVYRVTRPHGCALRARAARCKWRDVCQRSGTTAA
jgi:hypothetical protein